MNRKVLVVVGAAVLLALVGWRLLGKKPLLVGVVAPVTGLNAEEGSGLRNGILLALEEVNAKGGVQGHRVEPVEVDEPAGNDGAIAASRKLLDDPRVVGAVGYLTAEAFFAAHDVFMTPHFPLVLPCLRGRETHHLVSSGSNEFSLCPLGVEQAMGLARWAIASGAQNRVYVRETSFDGLSEVNRFRDALSKVVGKLVSGGDEAVSLDVADYAPLAERLRAAGNDLIFFGGLPRQGGRLLRQLRAAGVTAPFILGAPAPDDAFIAEAKEAAEGALATFPARPLEDTEVGRAFLAKYKARGFAAPAGHFALFGYLAAQTLTEALDRSFLTRPSLAGALKKEALPTAAGTVKYFVGGSTYPVQQVLYQVKGGRWVPVLVLEKDGALKPY
jgi:branched-chain amino acid transport system substrate-binding protein